MSVHLDTASLRARSPIQSGPQSPVEDRRIPSIASDHLPSESASSRSLLHRVIEIITYPFRKIAEILKRIFRAQQPQANQAPTPPAQNIIVLDDDDDATETTSLQEPRESQFQTAIHIQKEDSQKTALKKADQIIDEYFAHQEQNANFLPPPIDLINRKKGDRSGYLSDGSITDVMRSYINHTLPESERPYVSFAALKSEATCLKRRFPTHCANKKVHRSLLSKSQELPKKGKLLYSYHHCAHFRGIFVDIGKKIIVLYDPFGKSSESNDEFKALVKNIKEHYFAKNSTVEVIGIQKQHQQELYNCGRYTLNFLLEMLKAKDPKKAIKSLEKANISKDQIRMRAIGWAQKHFEDCPF